MIDDSFLDSVCMTKYLGFSNPVSKKLASLMHYTKNLRDLGITNLGRIMIPVTYGKYSITAVGFVPPVVPYCERTIGIVTFENKLRITMNTITADKAKEYEYFNNIAKYFSIISNATEMPKENCLTEENIEKR
jgi:hypothetical protein